ncbi:MAG: DDE transposase [Acidobacteria bacterium]|nr:MAG: DDE transposase [Acidobacteriota bacterium]
MNEPKTLQEAILYFSDEQTCINTVAALRWPDGVTCPACEGKEHYYLATQKRWKCKECGRQFSVKIGTIFEDSPIKLDKWLTALWMIVNCKNGVSSYEVHRTIGVTQKSSWFMLQRLRLALQSGSITKLGGSGTPVEMDETFIGGKVKNMHKAKKPKAATKSRGIVGKTIVVGMLERNGRVKAQVVESRTQAVLHELIRKNVATGTILMTDEHGGYRGTDFEHEIINHANEYVNGLVHTNGIENFWSLLKRGLNGTYVSVEPLHLFRYIDEQAFRFNNRKQKGQNLNDSDRFQIALSQISGKRLTYAEVTGKC